MDSYITYLSLREARVQAGNHWNGRFAILHICPKPCLPDYICPLPCGISSRPPTHPHSSDFPRGPRAAEMVKKSGGAVLPLEALGTKHVYNTQIFPPSVPQPPKFQLNALQNGSHSAVRSEAPVLSPFYR